MRVELRPVVRMLGLQHTTLEDVPIHSGCVGESDVLAVITGIGVDAATRTTEWLLRATTVEHVVVVGIAGGVAADLLIGDVVVPEVVVMASTGDEYRQTPPGSTPLRGRLLTSAELKTGRPVLDSLRAEGVTAVDMETAAVAAACQREGVPWSAFRAISDRLVDDIIDDSFIGMVNPDGTPRLGATLRFLARRPTAIRGLIKLTRDTRVATEAAALAAIRACV